MAPEQRLKYIARLAIKLRDRQATRDGESFELADRISLLAAFSDATIEANRAELLKGVEDAA